MGVPAGPAPSARRPRRVFPKLGLGAPSAARARPRARRRRPAAAIAVPTATPPFFPTFVRQLLRGGGAQAAWRPERLSRRDGPRDGERAGGPGRQVEPDLVWLSSSCVAGSRDCA